MRDSFAVSALCCALLCLLLFSHARPAAAAASQPSVIVVACGGSCAAAEWAQRFAALRSALSAADVRVLEGRAATAADLHAVTAGAQLRAAVIASTLGLPAADALITACTAAGGRAIVVLDEVGDARDYTAWLARRGEEGIALIVPRPEVAGFAAGAMAAAAVAAGDAARIVEDESDATALAGGARASALRAHIGVAAAVSHYCEVCPHASDSITMEASLAPAGSATTTQDAAFVRIGAQGSKCSALPPCAAATVVVAASGFVDAHVAVWLRWDRAVSELSELLLGARDTLILGPEAGDVQLGEALGADAQVGMEWQHLVQRGLDALELLRAAAGGPSPLGDVDAATGRALVPLQSSGGSRSARAVRWAATAASVVESPTCICPDAELHGGRRACLVIQLTAPQVLSLDAATGTLQPAESVGCTFLKNSAYVLTANGTLIAFGGSRGALVTQHQLVAHVEWAPKGDRVIRVSCDAAPTQATGSAPSPRASAAMALNGTAFALLHGGLCELMLPCDDWWQLDLRDLRWSRLALPVARSDATTAAGSDTRDRPRLASPVARFAHAMVSFEAALCAGDVCDSRWAIVVGGRAAMLLFEPLLVALQERVIVPLPLPSSSFNSARVCVVQRGARLLVMGGAVPGGVSRDLRGFSLETFEWSLYRLEEWGGGPMSCSTLAHFDAPANNSTMTSAADEMLHVITASSGPSLTSIGMLHLAFRSCSAALGEVDDPTGQTCVQCDAGFIAVGGRCTPCHSSRASDYREQWERERCVDGAANDSVVAGFIVAVVLQVLVTPAVYVVVRLARAADAMQLNERDAANIAEAVADMKFERVAYLEDPQAPLPPLQLALRGIIRNLRRYRTFLPLAVLNIADQVIVEGSGAHSTDTSRRASEVPHGEGAAWLPLGEADSGSSNGDQQDRDEGMSVLSMEAPPTLVSVAHGSTVIQRHSRPSRQHTAARIVAALRPHSYVEDCTVIATNVDGFYRWCEALSVINGLAARVTQLHDAIGECVLMTGGVVQSVHGDKMIAVWRPSAGVAAHARGAMEAACAITEHRMIEGLGAHITMGISSGSAYVGIAGDTRSCSAFVLGPVIAEAVALCRLTRGFHCRALVEYTPSVEGPLSEEFVFRIVGNGFFDRTERSMLPRGATSRQPRPLKDAVGVVRRAQTSVALLAELEGPVNDPCWVYERRGMKEHIDTSNTIMRLVALRNDLKTARTIALTDMPQLMKQQLRSVLMEGRLQEAFVDCSV